MKKAKQMKPTDKEYKMAMEGFKNMFKSMANK